MARSCSCNDFTRSQLLRRGVAIAGKGLPRIEPGMPLPAGTGLDRRTFLLRSAGAALSVYGTSMLSPRHFEEGIAQASAAAGPNQPVLVSIFMEGGWDALSVLAPVTEARYKELRPTLGLVEGSGKVFTEDENLMWHPAAGGLAELHEEGKVTVFPAIGYEPSEESHFTSRHYWEVGQLDANARSGWMGRYLDLVGEPDNPLQGLSLDYSLAPALATASDARRRGLLTGRLHDVGVRLGRTGDRAGAGDLRRAGRAVGAVARVRAGSQRLLRHEPGARRDGQLRQVRERIGRLTHRSPIRRANSPNGSRCSRRCSTPECRSNVSR